MDYWKRQRNYLSHIIAEYEDKGWAVPRRIQDEYKLALAAIKAHSASSH